MKCAVCGRSAERARLPQYQRRYCSEDCRLELIRRRSKAWAYDPEKKREQNKRYKAEKREAVMAYQREYRLQRGHKPRPPKPGTELVLSTVVQGGPTSPIRLAPVPRTFCAGACAYDGCDALFVARGTQDRFCSKLCNKRWWRQHTRKARREESRNVRIMVFVADGWACRLCGEPTVDELVPHPKAPTVDHVIPTARGGPDIIENMQTAHFICNSEKRDMTMDEWNGRSRACA